MYPLVKFVEAPDPAAAVRYDFNRAEDGAATRRVMAEGFTLGSPTLEGAPDAVGVTYGWRQPFIPQRVKGTKAEALAALSSLSRELLQPTNWLLVQVSATTAPVWLKIYRSAFGALSLREVYVKTKTGDPVLMPDTWDIPVPLVADPFGYGERVTLAPVTVTQTPDGDNPMRIVLPAIKGDAPTPLRVQLVQAASSTILNSRWLVGCVPGTAAMTDTVVDIGTGDGFTAGTGTSAAAANAAYFNGSYRTVTISADDLSAGFNLAQRLTGDIAGLEPGRYKVLLRCEIVGTAGLDRVFTFAFGTSLGAAVYGPTVTVDVGDGIGQGWVDLGDFAFPFGAICPEDLVVTLPAQTFFLKAGTPDNSAAAVRIDAFKFIPVDGPTVSSPASMLMAGSHTANAPRTTVGGKNIFDGDSEAYVFLDASDELLGSGVVLTGGFPVADPGAEQNLLVAVALGGDAGTTPHVTGGPASLDAETDVTVSYHPRLLHLGDGT